MRLIFLIVGAALLGAGCGPIPEMVPAPPDILREETAAIFPVENYVAGCTFKAFGEYIQDRFRGYHAADDVEVAAEDRAREIPVVAIADGVIVVKRRASGYGGVVVVEHEVGGETVRAIYGHLDLGSVGKNAGDRLGKGERIGNLGDHESAETDGERKHLHFALYSGGETRIAGYVQFPAALRAWINPHDFFARHGLDPQPPARRFDPAVELGGDDFRISFEIPAGWEVEYVPEIKALNIFTLPGAGSARERSQIFIRFFDADRFLTLSTVTIHGTEELTVNGREARRYDIEKKPGVADFPFQPGFRNGRHTVTDIRTGPGATRFYVIAAHPSVPRGVAEQFIQSIRFPE